MQPKRSQKPRSPGVAEASDTGDGDTLARTAWRKATVGVSQGPHFERAQFHSLQYLAASGPATVSNQVRQCASITDATLNTDSVRRGGFHA